MEYERGFHGWLVFFFVTTCIGVLLRGYILFQGGQTLRLAVSVGDGKLVGSVIARILIDAALLWGMVYGLRLFLNEDRRTPTVWATLFLGSMAGALLTYSLMAFETAYYQGTMFSTTLWDSLRRGGLRGLLVYGVWALYWMRSKRVRLTYGHNAFEAPSSSRDVMSAPVT